MKTIISKYKIGVAALALALPLTFTSCEDFLDVKPKTEVEASDLFSREQGFQDALWGVYTQMTNTSMYGREMTWGMVDVIGQVYSDCGSGNYKYMKNYAYDNANVESTINAMWTGAYTAIANVNSLILNLEKADQKMFAPNHYNVLLGEAYALRAFLHFDVLRLFAPSYAVDPQAMAIPYVKTYGYEVTPQSTVTEALDLAIEDLKKATDLMKLSDPIATGAKVSADDALLKDRQFHMNYFAALSELARVYLYKNDLNNAAACAKQVIDAKKFPWTSIDNIAASSTNRDRTFSTEHIFALQMQKMEDNVANYLTETKYSGNRFTVYNYQSSWSKNYDVLNRRYPDASDWRKLYLWSDAVAGSYYGNCFCTKLWQVEGMPAGYSKRMPLIRLPELYLILAEAQGDQGAATLQTVREHRGIEAEVKAADAAALRNEIITEYLREFVCEGQMFFQYKRVNSTTMDGLTGTFNTAKYVLPMPEEEKEFGGRK